jgi:hypothetical protein
VVTFIQSNRDQAYLLPPDMKRWLPDGDLAHFMVAAVDRVWLGPFDVAERAGGKPQYRQPLLMPEAIASRLAAKSDWTVRALASDLQAEAVVVPHDMVWRFLRHQGFSIKKRCS